MAPTGPEIDPTNTRATRTTLTGSSRKPTAFRRPATYPTCCRCRSSKPNRVAGSWERTRTDSAATTTQQQRVHGDNQRSIRSPGRPEQRASTGVPDHSWEARTSSGTTSHSQPRDRRPTRPGLIVSTMARPTHFEPPTSPAPTRHWRSRQPPSPPCSAQDRASLTFGHPHSRS